MISVERRYGQSIVDQRTGWTRRECWGARTTDGTWDLVRLDEPGTRWVVTHVESGRTVPFLMRDHPGDRWERTGPYTYGTLRKALRAIERGDAERFLAMEGTR